MVEEGKNGWLTVKHLLYPCWMEETEQGRELQKLAKEAGASCQGIRAGWSGSQNFWTILAGWPATGSM